MNGDVGESGETSEDRTQQQGMEEGPLALSSGTLATEVLQRWWQTPVVPCALTTRLTLVFPEPPAQVACFVMAPVCGTIPTCQCLHPDAGHAGHRCSSQMDQKQCSHATVTMPVHAHHLSIDSTLKAPVSLSPDIQLLFPREKGKKLKRCPEGRSQKTPAV